MSAEGTYRLWREAGLPVPRRRARRRIASGRPRPTPPTACTTYRPNDVTGAILELNQSNEPVTEPAGAPTTATANGAIPRPSTLLGITYKLRWPDFDHAIYVTINDAIHEGRQRPFEIFINSKNLEHYA